MANSVDPDQTAPIEANKVDPDQASPIGIHSVCFYTLNCQ